MRSRVSVVLLCAGLVGSGIPAFHTSAQASATATPSPTDTVARAFAEAKRSGLRVKLPTLTSTTTEVFAEPNGSYTAELSAEPVRFRGPDGWRSIDTTLVFNEDGSVSPRSVEAPLRLGGKGSATLIETRRGGVDFSWTWPFGPLPAPLIAGETATYPEVLPGVDLVVQALGQGFAEYVVVKNASAAALPEVRGLRFGWSIGARGTVTQDARSFTVRNRDGAPVFRGSQALMWSASGPTSTAPSMSRSSTEPLSVPALEQLTPLEGAPVVPLSVVASSDGISLTSSTASLTGPGVKYPLIIDPSVVSPGVAHRAMVDKSFPTTEYYDWSSSDQGLGYQNYDGVNTKRLFWMFAVPSTVFTNVSGSKTNVTRATLTVTETHAASCTPRAVEAWLTGAITAGSNWNAQPAWTQRQDSKTVSYGRAGCATKTGVSPNVTNVEFNVGAGMQTAVNVKAAYTTFGLRAASETDPTAWKRFARGASLLVNFNHTPHPPSSLSGPGGACNTTSSMASTRSFRMNAKLLDSDAGDTLTGVFAVYRASDNAVISRIAKGPAAQGSFYADVSNLAAGQYYWQVSSTDSQPSTTYSVKCLFMVDVTPPGTPIVSFDSAPALVDDDGDPSTPAASVLALGAANGVTFAPASSGDKVTRYRWSINSDLPLSGDVAATSPRANVTVTSSGLSVLRVWAFDSVGNQSAPSVKRLSVASGFPARWSLDSSASAVAADPACLPTANSIQWNGASSAVQGASYSLRPAEAAAAANDLARDFTGAGFGSSSTAGLLNPASAELTNYSVSLWARLAGSDSVIKDGYFVGTAPRTLVSLDHSSTRAAAAVTLERTSEGHPLLVARSYSTSGQSVSVSLNNLDFSAWQSNWYYVTLSVSAELGLSLQVDQTMAFEGVPAFASGTLVAATPWPATYSPAPPASSWRIASGSAATATPVNAWLGSIDEVRVFKAPLIPDALARPDVDLVGSSETARWFGYVPPYAAGSPCTVSP